MGGVEYQVTKVDPTDPQTKGAVYQVHKVSEEIAATLGGKVYRARIINDPTEPTVAGKVYQIVLIGDPSDPAVKGKVYNAILAGGSEAVIVGPAVSPLELPDAIANSLSYVKAFGGTEQNGTPTPGAPVDIVSNNGVLEFQDSELPSEYRRVLGYACNNNVLWQITDFHLRGSDTIRLSFSVTAACNVFGCYQGTDATDNYDLYVSTTSGSEYLRYGDGTYLSYWSSDNMGQRFDVVFTPTGTSGMPQDSTWTPLTFESENNLLLAATTLTGTSSKLRGNLYGSFVVDGRLKLIPCERVSDSALGYYDTYTGTFYEPTGTPTSLGYDFSYYSIKTSGPVETIGTHGKNWWNPDVDSYEAFYVTTGTQYERYGHIYRNGTYTISRSSSAGNWIIYAKLVHNGVYGTALNVTPDQTRTLTATGDDKILVYSSSSSPVDTTMYEVQVEQGSTATEYEPYYNGGTATAEILLNIGDYQDEQEILSGSVTRQVGAKPITGDMVTSYFPTSNRCTITTGDIITTRSPIICTHFPVATTGDYYVNHANDNQYIYCYSKDYSSLQDYRNFFDNQCTAGTPVIVIYPLATPTTESVAGQPLQVTDGDNVLEITQAGMDGLELEVTYEKEAE